MLLPFLPFIGTPSALLGLQPICCYQILGTHYAFLTYHSLRTPNFVSATEAKQCLKSIVQSTPVHKHVIRACLGKCSLKPTLLTQPTQTTESGTSCTSVQVSSSASHSNPAERFPINLRLRMTHARRAKLLAMGVSIGYGPVFRPFSRGVPGLARTDAKPLAKL